MNELATIIESINKLVDVEDLLRLINYHVETIQIKGGKLRCFCPIHREVALRSLLIELEDKTYKCTMHRCPCFKGGPIVELWAKHQGLELIEAAIDIAERQQLPVDVDQLRNLGVNYLQNAEEALTAKELDKARAAIDQALKIDSRNSQIRMLSADIHEAAGDAAAAHQERLAIFDDVFDDQDLKLARTLIDPMMALKPEDPLLCERLIELTRREGNPQALYQALLMTADVKSKQGDTPSEIALLEEAARAIPPSRQLLERMAARYEAQQQLARQLQTLESLSALLKAEEDFEALLEVLERRSALDGQSLEVCQDRAQLLSQLGRQEDAFRQWLEILQRLRGLGQDAHAEEIIDKLLAQKPDDENLLSQKAELCQLGGDSDQAVGIYRRLIVITREAKRTDHVAGYYNLALAIAPQDLTLRREKAEFKLANDQLDSGLNELFSLADTCLGQSDETEGLAILERIASLASDDLDKRLRIGRCLERNGHEDQACETYGELARDLIDKDQFDAAQAVCEEVRRLRPSAPETLRLRVQAFLGNNRQTDAIEACRIAASQRLKGDDPEGAEAALVMALEIQPDDESTRAELAGLYETTGRPDKAIQTWLQTGRRQSRAKDHAAALDSVRQVLRLDPENIQARQMLAENLEANGQTQAAIEIWRQMAHVNPDKPADAHEGLKLLKHALELAPGDADLLEEVSRRVLDLDGPAQALPFVQRWLDTVNNTPDAPLAIEAYSLAAEHYPERHDWRAILARLLFDTNQPDEAAEHYACLHEAGKQQALDGIDAGEVLERLAELRPEQSGLQTELAEHFASSGRSRDAVAQFEKLAAGQLDRDCPEEAADLLKRALELEPTRNDLVALLADLMETLNRSGDAAHYLEQLAELNRRESYGAKNIPVLEKLLTHAPLRFDLHAELADLLELEGDIDRAIEQRYHLAKLFAQTEGQDDKVIGQCLKIRALSPEFIPARELLIDSWLTLGNCADARQELEQLGEMALEVNEPDRAESYFQRCMEIDPTDIANGERLARLYESQGKIAESVQARRQVLALYIESGETASAIRVLIDLRKVSPDDLDLHYQLARMMMDENAKRREAGEEWLNLIENALRQGDDSLALKALAEAKAGLQDDWPWRLRLAKTLATQGPSEMVTKEWIDLANQAIEAREYNIAREAAGEGLQGDSENIGLRELRADANRRLSNYDTAARDLRCLAERFAIEKQYAQSEHYLEKAIELNPRNDELLQMLADTQLARQCPEKAIESLVRLCELYRQSSDSARAIEQAQRIVKLDPSDERKDFLAGLMVAADRTDEAIGVWREIAERLTAANETDAAFARLSRILELKPGDIETLRQMADLTYETGGMLAAMSHFDRLMDALVNQQDIPAIETEYHRILEMEPGHLLIKERLADFIYDLGRHAEALDMFRAIAQTFIDDQNQPTEALRVLRHLKSIAPDNLAVRYQEASLLEKLGRSEEATQILRQIATNLRRAGALTESVETLTKAAELDQDKADLQLEVAEVYQQQGDIDQATRFLLRAIEIHDRNDQLDESVAILEKAINLNPERCDLPDALARIYERLGQLDKARDQWLELGEIHEIQDENDRACEIYHYVAQLMPSDMVSRRRLAVIHEESGNRVEALRELNTLSTLAAESDDSEQQVDFLQRMASLDPNNEATLQSLADVWSKLGRDADLFGALCSLERIYTTSGRYNESIQTLESLKALRPDDAGMMDRSIELQIKTGHAEEACTQGIELIKIHFSRGDDHHALETVRRIIEIDPDHLERRIMLARLIHENDRPDAAQQEFFLTASKLFGESNYEGCQQVCEAGLELFPKDVNLHDLAGRVLAKLGRTQEAIEVQLHLAMLYDERGEEARAGRVFETILEAQPDNQAVLEAMVDWSLRHDRDANAIELLIRLAESHYLAGSPVQAIENLEHAQVLDPDRLDLITRLAEIQMETGDEDKACENWRTAASGLLDQDQSEKAVGILERLHTLKGDDLEIMAQLGEACRRAGRATQHQQLLTELGNLYLEAQRHEDALHVFEELSQCYPSEPEIWERLAALHGDLENLSGATEAYRHLAEIHRTARRFDQAHQCLESALALQPDDTTMLELLGDLCLSISRRPEGIGHLTRAARLLYENDAPGKARDLAYRILKLEPANLPVRHLLGEVLEKSGELKNALEEYVQAARGFADLRENGPAIQIVEHLLCLEPERRDERELYAKLLLREEREEECVTQYLLLLESLSDQDDPRRAIKFCRQILSAQPDQPEAHAHLCTVYERTEKLRQAFGECEWLADYYLLKEESDQSLHFIEMGLGWFPEDLGMRRRQIDLLISKEDLQPATLQLAELAQLAESRSDARTTAWALKKACEIDPDNLNHLMRLADYQERSGNLSAAREQRMAIIGKMLEAGQMEQARTLSDRVVETVIEDDELRMKIAHMFAEAGLPEVSAFHYHHMAQRALKQGEFEEARQYAEQAIELKARHAGARETLIEALLAQRENSRAAEEYANLFDIFIESEQWDAALRVMLAIIQICPSEPGPRCKLIELYKTMHRKEAMVEQMRRLVEIEVNAGNHDEAIVWLRELMTQRPDDTRARLRYIDLYTQTGEELDLIEDYLQLARIMARKGSVVEATRIYEKIIHLHPEEPSCREEFVQFLFEQGQVHRAIEETRQLVDRYEALKVDQQACRALERAINFVPDELELRERLAAIYLRLNRRGLAMEAYRTLARQYENANSPQKLIEVVANIVEIDPLNVEYRQQLAELHQQNGDIEQATLEFIELADQYHSRGLFDLAEQEYRRVLEHQPRNADIWQKTVDTHVEVGVLSEIIPDLIMLAELYSTQGRLKEAVQTYRKILDCEPDSIEVLNQYIETYIQIGLEQDLVSVYLHLAELHTRHGDVQEAVRVYQHLTDISPDNAEARLGLDQTSNLVKNPRSTPAAPSTPTPPTHPEANVDSTNPTSDKAIKPTLKKLIRNYENILKLNPQNPMARTKLAELLEQCNDIARAREHWSIAAESFFAKGDFEHCLEICERELKKSPDTAKLRDLLSRANVQRDSIKLIDGAISAELKDF